MSQLNNWERYKDINNKLIKSAVRRKKKRLFHQFTEEVSKEPPNRTAHKLSKLLLLKQRNTETLKQGKEIYPCATTAFFSNGQHDASVVASRTFIPDAKFKAALSTVLHSSRTKKAAGPDGIIAEMFQQNVPLFTSIIFKLWTAAGRLGRRRIDGPGFVV